MSALPDFLTDYPYPHGVNRLNLATQEVTTSSDPANLVSGYQISLVPGESAGSQADGSDSAVILGFNFTKINSGDLSAGVQGYTFDNPVAIQNNVAVVSSSLVVGPKSLSSYSLVIDPTPSIVSSVAALDVNFKLVANGSDVATTLTYNFDHNVTTAGTLRSNGNLYVGSDFIVNSVTGEVTIPKLSIPSVLSTVAGTSLTLDSGAVLELGSSTYSLGGSGAATLAATTVDSLALNMANSIDIIAANSPYPSSISAGYIRLGGSSSSYYIDSDGNANLNNLSFTNLNLGSVDLSAGDVTPIGTGTYNSDTLAHYLGGILDMLATLTSVPAP